MFSTRHRNDRPEVELLHKLNINLAIMLSKDFIMAALNCNSVNVKWQEVEGQLKQQGYSTRGLYLLKLKREKQDGALA